MISFRATDKQLYVLCFVSPCFRFLLGFSAFVLRKTKKWLRVQLKPRRFMKCNRELACALCVTVTQCPRIVILVPSLSRQQKSVHVYFRELFLFYITLRNRGLLLSFRTEDEKGKKQTNNNDKQTEKVKGQFALPACQPWAVQVTKERVLRVERQVVKTNLRRKKERVICVQRLEILPFISHVVFLDVRQYVTKHFQVTVGLIDVL